MEGVVYVAWLYSIPLGFILLQDNYIKTCTIRGTWVDPGFRGWGVGKFLLTKILEKNSDVDIVVNVTKGAEKFYEKFGFVKIGHRDDFDMDIYAWYAQEK